MNFAGGKIITPRQAEAVAADLRERVNRTLKVGRLSTEMVMRACDRLLKELDIVKYGQQMSQMGVSDVRAGEYLMGIREMFSYEYLRKRVETELVDFGQWVPYGRRGEVKQVLQPLGALMLISAGNMDGLPAFSVIEGLLCGNICVLKLPKEESGISVSVLNELVMIEPRLAEYVYVFDFSSQDQQIMESLIRGVDGVAVWGSDSTISAVRGLVPPNVKLIEWGHKLSFAYVTKAGMDLSNLRGLAENICMTSQVLCSSCQGIYLDTQSMEEVYGFCESFLPVLDETAAVYAEGDDPGVRAQVSLQLQTEALEALYNPRRIFKGKLSSIIAYQGTELKAAIQHRNCWVRPLPRDMIVETLRRYKGTLQTVGLLCGKEERQELFGSLARAGVVRVTLGKRMSEGYCGAPHDGEYPLRRYTRIVSQDMED